MTLRLTLLLALALAPAACSSEVDDGGSPAPDAGSSAGAADAGESTPLPFLAECDPGNDQCDSSEGLLCFSFNNKGPHCTHSCSVPADCESPSPGCNGMGMCKAP
jgi:hypothetical protein